MRPQGLAAALAACSLLVACGGRKNPSQPDVVLLVLDTLRADHLGCYGYSRPTSPRLDRFASSATLYENAISTAPWTLPSHGSLFTGLLPFQHGAHTRRSGSTTRPTALSDQPATLAELFGEAGYATLGFAANAAFLSESYGLSRGFDSWAVRRAPAAQMVPRILARLDEEREPGTRPAFLFANFLDTHRPYNAAGRPDLAPDGSGSESVRLLNELLEPVLSGAEPADSPRLDRLCALYDASIANLDEALGDLFDGLRERDLFEPSLIAVTSDHGEAFGEHALLEHSKDVYQSLLHIPLMVKSPGQRVGQRSEPRVGLAQVPGLLLEHLPQVRSQAGSEHTALLDGPVFESLPVVAAENYYSRAKDFEDPAIGQRFERTRHVLFDQDTKWIGSSTGDPELYRLSTDPGEQQDLAPSLAQDSSRLGSRWAALRASLPVFESSQADALNAATRRALEELGYY